ncbi:MAG: GNAT family N-acetyltransferase [Lachnospiraceae bacterium]|nr:GNAT family N-acetyltransferase [Lachnospiraceae bacterium]
MKNEKYLDLFPIYLLCFPDYPLGEEVFFDLLKPEQNHVIKAFSGDGQTVGYAVICDNTITLICVLPLYRKKSHGRKLLQEAENFIRSKDKNGPVILGFANNYIFQGVPLDYGSVGFFEKYGYHADYHTTNMKLKLSDFDFGKLSLNEPEDISSRLAKETDKPALMEAVLDAQPLWQHYFADYDDVVMLTLYGDKIIGFLMLERDGARFKNDGGKSASIGCVGIIHEARGRGIGQRMVAEGVRWLKEQGCLEIELLYVAMVGWYEKLGFYPVSKQWMGGKK